MRDSIDRVALRYLGAVLLGLLLLVLHNTVQGGPAAVLVPQGASAWELSKLVYWPMLGACLATGRLGRAPRPFRGDLPAVVLASLGATAANWAVLTVAGSGGCVWRCGRRPWRRGSPSAPTAPGAPDSG